MLTIFSTPKPFHGHIGVIQTNAIQSWTLLRPQCEVILFGDEDGTAEIASELGVQHISDVDCNEYGTPLISSMFNITQNISSHELMCYVNADIILMSNFLKAIQQIDMRPFLLVGRRWDVDLKELLNFTHPDWEVHLGEYIERVGVLHPPTGIDYFVLPRGLYPSIPPFTVGRAGWDNWMIYRACALRVPIIDATKAITIVHQNHDYSHHPMGKAGVWRGAEAQQNRELMGGNEYFFGTSHATLILTPQGVRRALTMQHLYFRLESMSVLDPRLHFLRILKRVLIRSSKAIRSMLGIPKN